MFAALGQEQNALSIGHPFSVVLAAFVSVGREGKLTRFLPICAGEPQVALRAVCRCFGNADQNALAVGCEPRVTHSFQSPQLLVGRKGWCCGGRGGFGGGRCGRLRGEWW